MIEVETINRKYYRYTEKGFSIFDSPITDADAQTLNKIQTILKQLKSFDASQKLTKILKILRCKSIL